MEPRIAIVGAGGMAAYHVAGFRRAGATVTAVADARPEAAAEAARRFGIPGSYGSLEELLSAEGRGLDAISIVTPNKFHAPLAIAALSAGKHVYCEKPPALSAAETLAMKAAADKSGRTLMFDFNNRARPEAVALMDSIREGAVGTINSAQAVWIRRTGIPGFGGWFTTKSLSGGGPVIDLLHMMDLALYFMGYPEPELVLAQTFNDFIKDRTFKGPWGIPDRADGVTDVETAAHGMIRFRSGQVLSFRNSWAEMNRNEEVSVTFQGQKAGGRLARTFLVDGIDDQSVDICELYTHEHGRPVNRSVIVPQDKTMGRENAAANFVEAITGKAEPLNNVDEAVKLMKIIDAVYASARDGKAQAIS
jgi:predicted dehydrogenase